MPEQAVNVTHPEVAALVLRSLGGNSGWEVYCKRFDDIVKNEIEAKIFDPKTPEGERLALIHARRLLVDSYAPEKIRASLLVTATKEAERATSSRR